MTALGTGPFENDDARAFLDDIAGMAMPHRADRVLAALDGVLLTQGYVEAGAMAEAVAAAAAVGASRKPQEAALERGRPTWLVADSVPVPDETHEKARQLLRRAVRSKHNEWWQLWDETGLASDVEQSCARALAWLGDRDD